MVQEYRLAEDDLSEITALNRGDYIEKAQRKMDLIQQLQRVAPGTTIGLKIAQVEAVTRAELAVLLLEELKLQEVIQKRRPPDFDIHFPEPGASPSESPRGQPPQDLEGHWARNWVEAILPLDIDGLAVEAEGLFAPNHRLTRAEYAKINAGLLMLITGDPELENRYLGEKSHFPDVRSDLWAYPAIRLCVERGIMAADKITGAFAPQDPVSGIQALTIIRDLQNALRQEFD